MNQLTATKNIDIPKLTSLGGVDLQFYGFFISQNMGENRVLCIHTIRIVLALFCLVRGYPIPRKNPENQTPENSKVICLNLPNGGGLIQILPRSLDSSSYVVGGLWLHGMTRMGWDASSLSRKRTLKKTWRRKLGCSSRICCRYPPGRKFTC